MLIFPLDLEFKVIEMNSFNGFRWPNTTTNKTAENQIFYPPSVFDQALDNLQLSGKYFW